MVGAQNTAIISIISRAVKLDLGNCVLPVSLARTHTFPREFWPAVVG